MSEGRTRGEIWHVPPQLHKIAQSSNRQITCTGVTCTFPCTRRAHIPCKQSLQSTDNTSNQWKINKSILPKKTMKINKIKSHLTHTQINPFIFPQIYPNKGKKKRRFLLGLFEYVLYKQANIISLFFSPYFPVGPLKWGTAGCPLPSAGVPGLPVGGKHWGVDGVSGANESKYSEPRLEYHKAHGSLGHGRRGVTAAEYHDPPALD